MLMPLENNRYKRINVDASLEDAENLLSELYNNGCYAETIAFAKAYVRKFSSSYFILNVLGLASLQNGKLKLAVFALRKATLLDPNIPDAYNNLGVVFDRLGDFENALRSFKRSIAILPDDIDTYINLGNALRKQGKLDEAMSYFHHALEIEPNSEEIYMSLGNVYMHQGKLSKAIKAYEKAIENKPNFAEAYYYLATVLFQNENLIDAITACGNALKINPNYELAEAFLIHNLLYVCDWNRYGKLAASGAHLGLQIHAVSPFTMLFLEDSSENQLVRSKTYSDKHFKYKPLPKQPAPIEKPARIKVGFFSADFHDHATLFLLSGVLREFDKSKFELFGYSYGQSQSGEMRDNAVEQFSDFCDVSGKSDQDIVDLVNAQKLDIAIDLKAHTKDTRLGLFKYRLAPIQMSYLGYPGSTGTDFIDYIIADPVVIPEDQAKFYSEQIIYMPHTYQPNDNTRPIADTGSNRADFDLPENAFVFCCFNANNKISHKGFDIWMRILSQVKNSVLWLIGSNKWAIANLKKEAELRGIEPSRLVFANSVSHSEHLERHKHADLFIDTFFVNAHTTASDALWSGLPVVTKAGNQFAARVAASLLEAVGLSDLVTTTEAEYEALILHLAQNETDLKAIREMLGKSKLQSPLFDTKRYTRNFEKGLEEAYQLYFSGAASKDIWVKE